VPVPPAAADAVCRVGDIRSFLLTLKAALAKPRHWLVQQHRCLPVPLRRHHLVRRRRPMRCRHCTISFVGAPAPPLPHGLCLKDLCALEGSRSAAVARYARPRAHAADTGGASARAAATGGADICGCVALSDGHARSATRCRPRSPHCQCLLTVGCSGRRKHQP